MTPEQWSLDSRAGKRCGMFGCQNPPSLQHDEPWCGHWYCEDDARLHRCAAPPSAPRQKYFTLGFSLWLVIVVVLVVGGAIRGIRGRAKDRDRDTAAYPPAGSGLPMSIVPGQPTTGESVALIWSSRDGIAADNSFYITSPGVDRMPMITTWPITADGAAVGSGMKIDEACNYPGSYGATSEPAPAWSPNFKKTEPGLVGWSIMLRGAGGAQATEVEQRCPRCRRAYVVIGRYSGGIVIKAVGGRTFFDGCIDCLEEAVAAVGSR